MRKFWIENTQGQLWNLTPKNPYASGGSFFSGPDGLGIKTKIKSFEIENTFFVEEIDVSPQTISGTLYFSSYEHFDKFIKFVGNVHTTTRMKLYYSPEGISATNKLDPQWYKQVLISDLDKTEIDRKTGFLKCNIKFACLSRWKKDRSIVLELSRYGDPLVYPFIYPYVYGGSNNLAIEIDNEGNLPTSCLIKIEAETDTPHIRLTQNGEVISQARYRLLIRPGSYLLIDSRADTQEATLITTLGGNEIREDVYYTGEKDYAFQNFITIPSGKSLILISAMNTEFGRVSIEYSIQKELI
jgi:hypothetical protein